MDLNVAPCASQCSSSAATMAIDVVDGVVPLVDGGAGVLQNASPWRKR
jgi:hypothetical protein